MRDVMANAIAGRRYKCCIMRARGENFRMCISDQAELNPALKSG